MLSLLSRVLNWVGREMGCPKDGSGKNVNDPVSERAGVGGERAKSEREGERMRGISAHEGEKRERGGRKLKRRRKLEIEERERRLR